MDLLGGDSESEVDFTINEDYAKRYEKWRRGEEIQKLKDKYGDVEDSESSSSEEDEDGKELTEDVEKQFFKTLSCLKQKNPKIYDKNVQFFQKNETDKEIKIEKKKNEEPLTVAGYQRRVLLETEGQFDDPEEHDDKAFEMMSSQEQEKDIKQSFRDVLNDSENEDESQWGNLFTKRIKTAQELEKEEEDYRKWLAGENEKLNNNQVKDELKGLHDYWTDPKLDESEKFLRDYILNKRYLEHEDKNRVPSYDEIVHDSDSNLSADEEMINQQDEFERKYNFRFEEPDQDFIKRYPRTMEQSMRRKDEKRKKQREDLKQRKQAERWKKDEELKKLKALKKKEIMEKIKKLQHITGNEEIAFETKDLEGDFDPEEHDRRMSQIFNEDYYGAGDDEEDKPEFPDHDEELEIENWDNWERPNQEDEELHCEDPGFNMDCDYDPMKKELQKELIENSRRRKKRKKSKFAEALEREKPAFDPNDKTYEQYIDEYYALDYEDLIGDIPCRFKYRKVVPNDFGLSIEEILNASDKELNRWVSIKKITRRAPEHVEKYDVKAYKRKAANFNKKAKCFPSLYGPKSDEWDQQHPEVGAGGGLIRPEEESFKYSNGRESDAATEPVHSVDDYEPGKKKRKKKTSGSDPASLPESENLSEKNISPDGTSDMSEEKRKKKKKQKGDVMNEEVSCQQEGTPSENVANSSSESGKKKKKHKGDAMNGGEPCQQEGLPSGPAESDKKKKKQKGDVMNEERQKVEEVPSENAANNSAESGKKKKKKKRKADVGNAGDPCQKVVSVPSENVANGSMESGKKKKKKKKKSGQQGKSEPVNSGGFSDSKKRKSDINVEGNNVQSRKKQKFNNSHEKGDSLCGISDERLRSYGLNPKKYKNKLKYKNKGKMN